VPFERKQGMKADSSNPIFFPPLGSLPKMKAFNSARSSAARHWWGLIPRATRFITSFFHPIQDVGGTTLYISFHTQT